MNTWVSMSIEKEQKVGLQCNAMQNDLLFQVWTQFSWSSGWPHQTSMHASSLLMPHHWKVFVDGTKPMHTFLSLDLLFPVWPLWCGGKWARNLVHCITPSNIFNSSAVICPPTHTMHLLEHDPMAQIVCTILGWKQCPNWQWMQRKAVFCYLFVFVFPVSFSWMCSLVTNEFCAERH